VTALVCHATCAAARHAAVERRAAREGQDLDGLRQLEEQFADSFVGQRIQPFWIEDEARKIEGTNFVVDQRFREFAVRDGLLITGQQQFSGAAAARLVIEALGR
jgi:putative intracellular protease/amidase